MGNPHDKFVRMGASAWQEPVLDKDLATPPGSPAEGDRYIVGPSATGDWSGHDDEIAEYNTAAWEFYVPAEGWRVDVKDENSEYRYSGSVWVNVSQQQKFFNFNLQLLGVGDSSYTQYGSGLFLGTDAVGTISYLKAVCGKEFGLGAMGVRIYDYTNSLVICEKTGITGTKAIHDLGTISNLPNGAAIFEVQAKVEGSPWNLAVIWDVTGIL